MSFLIRRYGGLQFCTSDVKQNLSAKWDRKDWYTVLKKAGALLTLGGYPLDPLGGGKCGFLFSKS